MPYLLAHLRDLRIGGARVVGCFFLDDCADGSEAVLRRAATGHPFPIVWEHGEAQPSPNAGAARRAAMAIGLDRLGSAYDAVLLTTDADSRPRHDWIAASLHALAIADVAAGRLVRSDQHADPIQTRVERYYDRLHAYRRTVDPVPWDSAGCHQGGGANLAIRASAYRAVGGFRPIPCGEDAALLDDAARHGLRVRHDPAMIVETSSRRDGRACGGLATALRQIDRMGLPQVPHPAAAAWQYRTQAAARHAFDRMIDERARRGFGDLIGLSADHVLGVARDCPNAEAFAMRIVPAGPGHDRLIPFAEAEAELARLERTVGAEAA